MDGIAPDERNASFDADMATLTYEDGLAEIDSFFNSSPTQADTITEANTGKDGQDDGVSTGEQAAPPTARADSKQPEQSVVPTTEQHVNTDEFATLIADLDQVTAHEAVPTNPKGQLHFILNDPTSPPPQATTQPSLPVVEAVAVPNIAEAPAAVTGTASPQPGLTPTQEETKPDLILNDGTQVAPATNYQPTVPDTAVPLASVHSEKGLTLLSPKPGQPVNPQPLSVTASLQQETIQDSLPITSPDNKSLPLPSPSQAPGIQPAMSHTTPAVASSPALPSSDGKASLMEEMRDEDYYAKHSRIPQDESMHQPDLIAVASKPSVKRQAASETTGKHGGAKTSTKEQILKDANLAQQRAKLVVASNRKQELPPPEMSDMTDVDETEDDAEDAVDTGNAQGTKLKAASNTKTKAGSSKPTRKSVQAKQQPKPAPQLRKSTRGQPAIQYQESDSDNAHDDAKTEPATEVTVPAKRKPKASTAPPAKRAKTEARPNARTAKSADGEPQRSAGAESEAAIGPSKAWVGGHPMGKREMKELLWAHVGPRVTPGPRKMRAQKEEEDRKKEEEEKKLPNAGRAAKERHKKKSG